MPLLNAASEKVKTALGKVSGQDILDIEELEKLITDTVGRHLERTYRRSPLITTVVIDA